MVGNRSIKIAAITWFNSLYPLFITLSTRGKKGALLNWQNLVLIFLQSKLDILCKASYTNFAKDALHHLRRITRQELWCGLDTRIPELRKARRLSQQELADAVGVTRQTITSLEVGKYTASLVLAYKLARYFGLPIEQVFDFSEVEE